MYVNMQKLTSALAPLCFVVESMVQYKVNSDIHVKNARQSSSLHQTTSNLSLYQKSTYHMGIKIFNRIPSYIKNLSLNFFYIHLSVCHYHKTRITIPQ